MWQFCVLAALLLADDTAAPKPAAAPSPLEQQNLGQLLTVRRVYVDRLTGGETAAQMRDMIISSLHGARLFVVTENVERADATLRGSAEDLVFTDTYSSSEGINASGTIGGANAARTIGKMHTPARGSGSTRTRVLPSASTKPPPQSGW